MKKCGSLSFKGDELQPNKKVLNIVRFKEGFAIHVHPQLRTSRSI